MNIAVEYINYLFRAKGRHGIHSPFVYDLITKCLSIHYDDKDLLLIHEWDKLLKEDKEIIRINDLGAGSKKLYNDRKASDIYKISSSRKKYGKLLYQLARYYQPNQILELGTSLGTGTMFLHLGHKNAKITTIEGCPNTAKKASYNWKNVLETNKIKIEVANFVNVIENFENKFDMIFIDGNHKKSAVMMLLNNLNENIHDETIVIIDDIRWSADMKSLWLDLIERPDFHLTLDFFRMGIVMKRSHQRKEHFIIRY